MGGILPLLGAGPSAPAVAPTLESTFMGINGASLNAAGSYYCPPGGQIHVSGTSLTKAEIDWPFDCTIRNFRAHVSGSAWSVGITADVYVGGTSRLSAAISAGGTDGDSGATEYAVTAGDLFALGVTLPAGSGSIVIRQCTFEIEVDGQVKTVVMASNMNSAAAATVRWARMGGGPISTTLFGQPEADMQMKALESATLSKLQGYGTTSTANGATLTARKNGSAVSGMALTFTGADQRQGPDADSTTISLTGNGGNPDLFTIERGSAANLNCSNTAVMYQSDTPGVSMVQSGGQLSTIGAGTTGYCSLIGGLTVNPNNTTESNARGNVPIACTLSKVTLYIQNNASTATLTFTLMRAGNATSVANSTTAIANYTGYVELSGSEPFSANETVSIRVEGATTGAVTIVWAAALVTV